MKKITFFSLAFLVWAASYGQNRLSVKLIDINSNQPVTGATVTLIEQDERLTSNNQGLVVFSVSDAGTYGVEVQSDEYESAEKEVVVLTGADETFISIELTPLPTLLQSVEVSALRASELVPIAYTTVSKEALQERNTGRDVPFLLEQTPSVVATSDAGAGIGYTNIRVRGSDITRINVTVNGIPINDAESNGVFWVNMPDLASSTSSIQLQRGVGTSTNGASAFGATLNMETEAYQRQAHGNVNVGFGSFNTQRYTAQFGTGLINKHWWLSGRLSSITSDGYIDRASSDLKSYYVSGGYASENTSVRAVIFGGRERTYQAWYGVDSATLATDRTFNFAGAIYNANWEVVDFYDDQVDNYNQDHYQLHINQKLNDAFQLNVSLHYTYGRGYYEEYIQDGDMPFYNLDPIISGNDTINTTDLVRRKWLDNDFYGAIANLKFENEWLTSILGGGYNQYDGRHFGRVIWARYASQSQPDHEFYNSNSSKTDWNIYWKNLFRLQHNLSAFVDVQARGVKYNSAGLDDDVGNFSFSQDNLFFNPKVGLTYTFLAGNRVFASYAMAHREPNRTDLLYADPNDLPQPERLQDFELGIAGGNERISWQGNAFFMYYNNQLVLSGNLDAVGNPIRENIGQSYRIGVELAATWAPYQWLKWSPTITYMQSQNLDYIQENPDGTVLALGNTAIAYSPNIVGASNLEFYPVKGLTLGLFSKYVGEQYLNNSEVDRLALDAYFLNDVRIAYQFNPNWIEKINVYLNVMNVFNVDYSSNGYVYAVDPYYYPQAGINLLAGVMIDL